MQAATLDAEARRRAFVRQIIADLRMWGYTDGQLKGKTVGELIELQDRAARRMMGAPKAA